MSEPMQAPVSRPPRVERTTTSCGECRRRKQKCNQGQPCSNCARRFPQPLCEYKPGNRCAKLKTPIQDRDALRSPAVIPRRPSAVAVQRHPAFTISLFPPTLTGDGGSDNETFRHPYLPQISPLPSPWNQHSSRDAGEMPARRPGFDTPGHSLTTSSPSAYAWSTDRGNLATLISSCDDGCTSHSDEIHDAVRTLRVYRPTSMPWPSDGWSSESNTWTVSPVLPPGDVGGVPWPVANPAQELVHLPVAQTMKNAELLSIYVKLISQFKASLDGNPDASNPYTKYFVPYCVHSPLLVHVAAYTAACFLTDTGHVQRTVAMAHKGDVIRLLNEHIRSQHSTNDEVIAGVVQLIVDEWHWGNANDLRAHLRGLRGMIRSRGGFRTLGLHGLISKLAITTDVAIALSFEVSPFLQGGSEFEFCDSVQIPLRLPLNTPFISTLVPFSSCDDALRIHPTVAAILDDMRFLLAAILALPERPSAKELQKVYTTSAWIHERVSGLPADSPAARRPSEAAISPALPSATDSTVERGSRPTPETGRDEGQPQYQPPRWTPTHSFSPEEVYRRHESPHASAAPGQQHQQQQSYRPGPPSPPPPPPPQGAAAHSPPDYVYQSVRLSAILYSRAIMRRQPFSLVVTPAESLQLWTTTWRVPLSTWRSLLGIFNWILLPIVSVSGRPDGGGSASSHDRFVKGTMNISLFQMGMDNWEIACQVMDAGLSLQRWLAGAVEGSASPQFSSAPMEGGEEGEGMRRRTKEESCGSVANEEEGRGKGWVEEWSGARRGRGGKCIGERGWGLDSDDPAAAGQSEIFFFV
ncbi:Oleate activated transcription factor 3 [Madurella mycetomatis]|uniref:Oleate activated transcription factor 3 n=1 Tax=Madurella mycetomatis TaxID=100816 RepID=A0A175VSC4_9PEZI|nr:Oleate activated transcription factor 3 [Madurella mycetomatis]